MRSDRWGGTKMALGYAAVASCVSAAVYARNGWRRPESPHIHIGVTILLNFLGALILGPMIDGLKRFATSRTRAMLVGFIIGLPAFSLVYFGALPADLNTRQFLAASIITGFAGAVIGAAVWLPDDY